MSNETQREAIRCDGLDVISDGKRVTIPANDRGVLGIVPGQLVTARLVTDGDGSREFRSRMDEEGRLTIPKRFRDEYGIDADSTVDLEVPMGGFD